MALEFSVLIRSLLSSASWGLAKFVHFFLLVATFCLPVVIIPSLSGSSICMGVMINDEEGLDDDAKAQRE